MNPYFQTGSSQYRGRGGRPFRRGGRGRGRGVGGGRHFPSHSSGPATSDVSGASASAGATLVVQSSSSVPIPAQVPTAPRKVYCEICKVECNTPEIMEQHKNGKKHKKNMKVHEILQRQNATNGQQSGQIPTSQMNSTDQPKKVDESEAGKCPTKNMSSEITVDNQKDEMKLQNNVGETSEVPAEEPKGITMDNSAPRGRGLKRKMRGGKGAKRMRTNDGSKAVQVPKPEQDISFTCELCNVKCESHVVYQSHLTGKKHLSKLRRAHGHQATPGDQASSEAVGLGLQAHYPPDINALANAINAQVQQGDNDPQVLLAQLLMNVLSQAQASATAPMNGPLPAAQTPTPTSVAGSSYEPQLLQRQVSEITAHVELEKNPTGESENDMLSVPLQLNAQEGSGVSTQIVEGECSETK